MSSVALGASAAWGKPNLTVPSSIPGHCWLRPRITRPRRRPMPLCSPMQPPLLGSLLPSDSEACSLHAHPQDLGFSVEVDLALRGDREKG